MAIEDKLNVRLNQNIWALIVSLITLGAGLVVSDLTKVGFWGFSLGGGGFRKSSTLSS